MKKHLYTLLLLFFSLFIFYCTTDTTSDPSPEDQDDPVILEGFVADGYLSGATVLFQCDNGFSLSSPVTTTTISNGSFSFYSNDVAEYLENGCHIQVEATNLTSVFDSDDINGNGTALSLFEAGRSGFILKSISEKNDFISPITTLANYFGENTVAEHLEISTTDLYLNFIDGAGFTGDKTAVRQKAKVVNAYLEFLNESNFSNNLYSNLTQSNMKTIYSVVIDTTNYNRFSSDLISEMHQLYN